MGTGQRRQKEAARRREAILDAARRLFRQRGYTGATMPAVAEAAELATGTLYLYFANKDALFAELLTEGYERLLVRLEAAEQLDDAPAARGRALIEAFFEFAATYPEYFEMIFVVLQREGQPRYEDFPPELAQRLRGWKQACIEVVVRVLEQAGYGTAARRPVVAGALWTMLCGVVLYAGREADPDALAAEACELLLGAVFARQDTTPAEPPDGDKS